MYFLILYLLVFLFGLTVGSFLNCVIYRLEKQQGFLFSRSFCPKCRHTLSWKDLIPVFSFIFLRGKCRYCKKPVSWQYPIVETATASLFLLIFQQFLTMQAIFLAIITCFLIIIFVYDLKHYIIPDKVMFPAIVAAFLYQLFGILEFRILNLFGIWDLGFGILNPLLYSFLAALGAGGFFFTIWLISKGQWMGFGDVKLALFMGLFLGWPNILPALVSAFILGAAVGLTLMFLKKKTLKSQVPFGPFLIIGALIGLFWGSKVIHSYLSLFLW